MPGRGVARVGLRRRACRVEASLRSVTPSDGTLVERVLDKDAGDPVWLGVLPQYVVQDHAVVHEMVDEDTVQPAVLSLVRMRATVLEQERSGDFVLSDVRRRRDDGWRVWRRHSTPAAAPAMPGV